MYFLKRLIVILTVIFMMHNAQAAVSEDKLVVQKAYKDWCAAVSEAKGNPEVMVKFYAPDAVLLPTFYPKILVNRDNGLNDYFKTFTSNPDIKCIPDKLRTQLYHDVAVNSGFYHFTYKDKDGKLVTIPARFTFVYELVNGKWLIIEHHSSMKPTTQEESH